MQLIYLNEHVFGARNNFQSLQLQSKHKIQLDSVRCKTRKTIVSPMQLKLNRKLTCFWTKRALKWTLACMLICMELQVLTAFERFRANVTFVRSKVAVRDLMLLQRAIGWINATTCAT